jgi:hypothetical protein
MSPECFVDALALRARSALSETVARREIFSIGTVTFELAAPNCEPGNWLGNAFLSDASDAMQNCEPMHRLYAWDGTSPRVIPPARPWGPADHEPLGVVSTYSNENVRCAFDIHTSALIAYDFRHETSFSWFPSIGRLPAWARASPFRVPLSWLLNLNGHQIVHGAAVSMGGHAVILTGAGGSGKSTTALACALAGMGYLGDDYCSVEPTSGQVHMVYRTAKVLPTTLALLPALESWLVNSHRISVEKGVIFLKPSNVELVRSSALAAILLPRLSAGRQTRLSHASRSDTVRAILPSTIDGLMGGTAASLKAILQLVQNVPAFHLELGSDLDAVIDAVAKCMAS